MGKILTICAIAALFASMALAETYSGQLIDANCYDQQAGQKDVAACVPTSATSSFALMANDHIYKLDEQGNTKAAAALKDRADRMTDPDKAAKTNITAKVTGTIETGNTLKVETLEVQ